MKNAKKISAVLTALCLVLCAGCSEKKGDSSNNIVYYNESNSYSQAAEGVENSDGEYTPQEDILENIPTIPAKMNEPAELMGSTLKLTNVYDAGIIKADEIYSNDLQLLAFACEITNNTDSDMKVNSFCMSIRYIDGESTQITAGMREMLKAKERISNLELLNCTVKPGETVKGYSAISVSPEWKSLTLYYNPVNTIEKDSLAFEITKDMVEEPN